jgi:hypothetical protein
VVSRRWICCVLLAFAGTASAGAPNAFAATCAAYPNQAAAQRAADTRDADGDGIYCESLPCPCLKPGQSGARPFVAHRRPNGRRPRSLGRPVLLGPLRKKTGCHVRGGLPDPDCTPGAFYPKATRSVVCQPGYSALVRNVSRPSRDAVYAAYDLVHAFDGANGELDHLVSLELGGSNTRSNLFPESAFPRPGSADKDRLENVLHDDVCAGRITLRHAQRLIATDWVAEFRAHFG